MSIKWKYYVLAYVVFLALFYAFLRESHCNLIASVIDENTTLSHHVTKKRQLSAYEINKSFETIKLLLKRMLLFQTKNMHLLKSSKHRLFCFILTRKENFHTRALAVNRTWAKDCDKYFFVAQVSSELALNETYELHKPLPVIQPAGHNKEVYDKLTDKVFHTLREVYLNYPQYEWYLKADDDTFVFVDQLRIFLAGKSAHEPITYGHEFKVIVERGYLSGGAGYVLSGEALSRLGIELVNNQKRLNNSGNEDIDVALALHSLGILHASSLDDKGRERFHALDLSTHVSDSIKEWLVNYSAHKPKGGIECCSSNTISFHYMTPDKIENLYTLWTLLKNESSNKISNKTLNVDSLLYSLIL